MPQVGFEPTIPVFEQAKTVHVLDGAAIVIGYHNGVLRHFVIIRQSNIMLRVAAAVVRRPMFTSIFYA
jgi:hypothetical protein